MAEAGEVATIVVIPAGNPQEDQDALGDLAHCLAVDSHPGPFDPL